VLAALDLDKKMRMEVDASDYATGGVLLIEGENRKWRLVIFLSKSLMRQREIMKYTIKRYWQSSGGWRVGGIC